MARELRIDIATKIVERWVGAGVVDEAHALDLLKRGAR